MNTMKTYYYDDYSEALDIVVAVSKQVEAGDREVTALYSAIASLEKHIPDIQYIFLEHLRQSNELARQSSA